MDGHFLEVLAWSLIKSYVPVAKLLEEE